MIIQNVTPSSPNLSVSRNGTTDYTLFPPKSTSQSNTSDSVTLSEEAKATQSKQLASTKPPSLLNEKQIKMNLARILMESLFGKETDDETTPEEALIESMIEGPAAEQALSEMTSEMEKG